MKKLKEFNYFDQFLSIANDIEESAEKLKNTLTNYNYKDIENNITEVHKLENASDLKLHTLEKQLIMDFLPPIDREDISLIGHRLDDIEDDIDEILINFKILNIRKIKPETNEFLELLVKCAKEVKKLIEYFKNLKKPEEAKEYAIKINALEDEGDRLYERLMTDLYSNTKDAIEIIKWTSIFNCFEDTIDNCERLADCISDVIIKNS